MTSAILTETDVAQLVTDLVRGGTRVIAPVPAGVDWQDAEYRPIDRLEDAVLDGPLPVRSLKEFLRPGPQDGRGAPTPQVILGARPCDAAGVESLDRVMRLEYQDELWRARRSATTIVTIGFMLLVDGRLPVALGAVLFAIVFFWQFPHFFSIAWLYREDYASGGIRMLPVVQPDGRSTSVRIMLYSIVLIPITLAPTLLGMSGKLYFAGAIIMGIGLCYFGARLATLGLPLNAPRSKQRARQLLQATVIYLPLLFALMMLNTLSS